MLQTSYEGNIAEIIYTVTCLAGGMLPPVVKEFDMLFPLAFYQANMQLYSPRTYTTEMEVKLTLKEAGAT